MDTWARQERVLKGVTKPQRSTSAGWKGGSVCLYACVDRSESECACVCISTSCECFHFSVQVCNVNVCECVCTSRGESATRDLRSHATVQHLAADGRAAANKWAHSAGRPPPNPLRERLSFWTQS